MLKAVDTLPISLLYFSHLLENYIPPYLSVIWISLNLKFGLHLQNLSENVKNQKLYFIIHKNVLRKKKEKSPKMFRGHSIFNTRLWRSNSFSNKKQPGGCLQVFEIIPLGRGFLSDCLSPRSCVCECEG